MIISYFAKDTSRSEEEVKKDMERDFFMSSEQAKQYGIVDTIMVGKKHENK